MKIIQLVFHLGPGGGEKFVVNLSNQLVSYGHEVIIMQIRNDQDGFDIHFNKKFLSDKVKYINLGLTKGFTLGKCVQVMKSIKNLNPDVVHSHLNVLPYYYPLAIISRKIKFIHTLHSVANKECSNRKQQILNRWVYKHKYVIPVNISEECRLSFENLYKLSSEHCIVNGCPQISQTDALQEVSNEIKKLKHSETSKIFLHIARFNEAKNQGMLISAFNKIIEMGIDAELLVIGVGFESDKGLELKKTACERIHFLGPKSNVGDYLSCSDFFIMSSLWEGLPISLLEAMSAKVIPVTTPAGGIKDVIVDGENGFMSLDFQETNFIETIKRAISTKISKEKIYESFVKSYSIEECASKYIEVYKL